MPKYTKELQEPMHMHALRREERENIKEREKWKGEK